MNRQALPLAGLMQMVGQLRAGAFGPPLPLEQLGQRQVRGLPGGRRGQIALAHAILERAVRQPEKLPLGRQVQPQSSA